MAEKQKNFLAAVMMLCLLFVGSAGLSFLLTEIQAGNYNLSEQQITQGNVEPQKPRTFAWKEQYELCVLYHLDCSAKPMNVEESFFCGLTGRSISFA